MSNKSCFCGCSMFRFKKNDELFDEPQTLWYNICRDCNHSLGSHVNIIRSRQSE